MKMQGQGQARSQVTSQAPEPEPEPVQGQDPVQDQATSQSWASQSSAKGQALDLSKNPDLYPHELDLHGCSIGFGGKAGKITYFIILEGEVSGRPIGNLPVEWKRHVKLGIKTECENGKKKYIHFKRMSFSDELVRSQPHVKAWQDKINAVYAKEEAKMQEAFLASIDQ